MSKIRSDLFEICEELSEQEDLKVTYQFAVRDGMMVTFGAFLGGLLGGPMGFAIGGSSMAMLRYKINKGKFRSVADILKYDLTPQQQRKLTKSVQEAIRNLTFDDIINVLPFILNIGVLREAVLSEICFFIVHELKMDLIE